MPGGQRWVVASLCIGGDNYVTSQTAVRSGQSYFGEQVTRRTMSSASHVKVPLGDVASQVTVFMPRSMFDTLMSLALKPPGMDLAVSRARSSGLLATIAQPDSATNKAAMVNLYIFTPNMEIVRPHHISVVGAGNVETC